MTRIRKTQNYPNFTSNRFCVKFVFFHYVFMKVFDKGEDTLHIFLHKNQIIITDIMKWFITFYFIVIKINLEAIQY
jgi:hypothetical protein